MTWVSFQFDINSIIAAFLRVAGSFGQVQDAAALKAGDELINLFKRTASGSVRFSTQYSHSGLSSIVTAGTNDEIYTLLNEGAAGHYIYPVRARVLAYPAFFRPKTTPGQLTYNAGGGKFGPIVFRNFVWHPGFVGRKFDEAIEKEINGPPVIRAAIDSLVSIVRRLGLYITG